MEARRRRAKIAGEYSHTTYAGLESVTLAAEKLK